MDRKNYQRDRGSQKVPYNQTQLNQQIFTEPIG